MLWFVTCKGDLLLQNRSGTWQLPCSATPPVSTPRRVQPLPSLGGEQCCGIAVEYPVTGREDMQMFPLRKTYPLLPAEQYQMAGKAVELSFFDQNTRFCGLCGAPMKWHTDISKRCTECGKEQWPQLATAIIVRVERDDEILLVRARNFRGDFYGLVAGFVETGESLEECVCREVREETGIEIDGIRYLGSQPWPYPSGLMAGFAARHKSGTLHLQHSELSSGGWFSRDKVRLMGTEGSQPHIPDKASIARRLIDEWLEEEDEHANR